MSADTTVLYLSEHDVEPRHEDEPKGIHGEGVLMIHAQTGLVRAVRELVDKPATGRRRGDVTIPFETPKSVNGMPELTIDTFKGALAEMWNDTDVEGNPIQLHQYVRYLEGNSYHNGLHTTIQGRPISIGYTVALYDGPDFRVVPYNCMEVEDAHWTHPDELRGDKARSLAKMVIDDALGKGIYQGALSQYREDPERSRLFLPPTFSVAETYKLREVHPDMK